MAGPGMPLFRPKPELPAGQMRTHHILAPAATHWRKATCEEVGCLAYQHGWSLALTGLDEDDIWQARNAGRSYREETGDAGPMLVFEPGQPCFRTSTHRIRIDRPEIFLVREGDWRGNPRKIEPTTFSGADAWADSLHTNLSQIGE